MNRPAPKTITRLSATCSTINPYRSPLARAPLPDCLSAEITSIRAVSRAGVTPMRAAARRLTAAANPRVRTVMGRSSVPSSISPGSSNEISPVRIHRPNTRPAAAPKTAMAAHSTMRPRTSRPRDAPSARQTPTSRRRRAALATTRPATLAQAISSTTTTAVSRIAEKRETSPLTRPAIAADCMGTSHTGAFSPQERQLARA